MLASMTERSGMANPNSPIVPFGSFEEIHYARFVILDDQTLDDFAAFGKSIPSYPVALALAVDCDGSAEDCLAHLVRDAGDGLHQIFSHCEGYASKSDLQVWMKGHFQPSSASYVNWIGRTVHQVREEAALREFSLQKLRTWPIERSSLQKIREELVTLVRSGLQAGALTLAPPKATPLAWKMRDGFATARSFLQWANFACATGSHSSPRRMASSQAAPPPTPAPGRRGIRGDGLSLSAHDKPRSMPQAKSLSKAHKK